jgi:hypothetical protein
MCQVSAFSLPRLEPTSYPHLWKKLKAGMDDWDIENATVRELEPYSGYIPDSLLNAYVKSLVMTYIGYTGTSARFARTDFYADGAALRIPKMFQAFDDKASGAFVYAIRGNTELRNRIRNPAKMARLRTLRNIVVGKISTRFPDIGILNALVDPASERKFMSLLDKRA